MESKGPRLLRLRQLVFFTLVALCSWQGVYMMFDILRANGFTLTELSILLLFTVMFVWLVVSFWNGIAGFLVVVFKRDPWSLGRIKPLPETLDASRRVALLMPVYNEDTVGVIAGLEATCRSLIDTGKAEAFDVYLLSDSTDPQIAAAERQAASALRQRLTPHLTLYYRHRERNVGRKVGNLADFCRRWGNRYESMVIIDADSVMGGRTLVRLAATMQADPRLGLLQTVPLPVRSSTLFGRFVQFAATLYSPMLAAGQSAWQGGAANYWGHNAIIRVKAFAAHCGLPDLPGKAPLGGDILSHDFVEAAMLRRGGWRVRLHAGIEDSYEGLPSNLLEFAKRDRRWCQGNLQHLRLVFASGLHWINRLHFVFGALAYAASLLWLCMLALSTVDALRRAIMPVEFFDEGYQLFPEWPQSRVLMIASLLVVTVLLLVLPKFLGFLIALFQRPRGFGGSIKLFLSATLEIAFSVLIAPLMMAFHAWFVLSVLMGRTVSWGSQTREGRLVPWSEAWRRTAFITVLGLVWGALSYTYAPLFFWWLAPVLLGMVIAAPLVRFTSSLKAGGWLRRHGWLCIPAEVAPPQVIDYLEEFEQRLELTSGQAEQNVLEDALPDRQEPDVLLPEKEYPLSMPIQSLSAPWGLGGSRPVDPAERASD